MGGRENERSEEKKAREREREREISWFFLTEEKFQ